MISGLAIIWIVGFIGWFITRPDNSYQGDVIAVAFGFEVIQTLLHTGIWIIASSFFSFVFVICKYYGWL